MKCKVFIYAALCLYSITSILAQYKYAQEVQLLAVPKGYSNLRIPGRRRNHAGSGRMRFPSVAFSAPFMPTSAEEQDSVPDTDTYSYGPPKLAFGPPVAINPYSDTSSNITSLVHVIAPDNGTVRLDTAGPPGPERPTYGTRRLSYRPPVSINPYSDTSSNVTSRVHVIAPDDDTASLDTAGHGHEASAFVPPDTFSPQSNASSNSTPHIYIVRHYETDWMDSAAGLEPAADENGTEEDVTEPIAVNVAMQIQSIREIDEEEQKIIFEVDLTVHWKDYDFLPADDSYKPADLENVTALLRQFTAEPLSLVEFDKLWKPDIFIERVVKVTKPGLLSSPVTVRAIRAASSIVYTTRASVKVDCNMDFQYYPADTQNCILDLRSYQHDETKMALRWNPVPGAYLVDADTDDNFDLQLSYVAQRKKRVKDINLDDAVFDVLQIKVSMRRRMTYHLLQTYTPSAFLVFITWLSFLIPEELIEARIGISLTTLLTLTAMFAAVRENTPVVSYIKAIDIWMAYCIFIVFATLLEFSFFVWLRNYRIAKRERKLQTLICDGEPKRGSSSATAEAKKGQAIDDITMRAALAFEHTARILNQFAFGFFVLSFIVFNAIYWPWVIVSSEHNRWTMNETLNGKGDSNGGFMDEL